MANGTGADVVNLTLIKQYKTDFESEKSTFQHSSFTTFTNGYINSCNDPYIKIMAQRLNTKYSSVDDAYFKILEWWNNFVNAYENAENSNMIGDDSNFFNNLFTNLVLDDAFSQDDLNLKSKFGESLKGIESIINGNISDMRANPEVQAAEAIKRENQKFYDMIAKDNQQLASIIQMQTEALKEEGVELTYEETYYMLLQSIIQDKINNEATTQEEQQKLLEEITNGIKKYGEGYAYNLIVSYFDNIEADYIKEKTEYYKKHPIKKFFCGDEISNEGFCSYYERYLKDETYMVIDQFAKAIGSSCSFVSGAFAKESGLLSKAFGALGMEDKSDYFYNRKNDFVYEADYFNDNWINGEYAQKASMGYQDIMGTMFLALPENKITEFLVGGYYKVATTLPVIAVSLAGAQAMGAAGSFFAESSAISAGATTAEVATAAANGAKMGAGAFNVINGAIQQAGGDVAENISYNLDHGIDALKGTNATYFGGIAYGGFTGYFGNKIGINNGSIAGSIANVFIDAGQGGLDVLYGSAIKGTYNGQSFSENFADYGGIKGMLESGFTAALTSITTDGINRLGEKIDARKYKPQMDENLDMNTKINTEVENNDKVHFKDQLSDYLKKFSSGLGKLATNNAGYVDLGAIADLFGFNRIKNSLDKIKGKFSNNKTPEFSIKNDTERVFNSEHGYQLNGSDIDGYYDAMLRTGFFDESTLNRILDVINNKGYMTESTGNYIKSLFNNSNYDIYIKTIYDTDLPSILEKGIYCNGNASSGFGTSPTNKNSIDFENTITQLDSIIEATDKIKSAHGLSQANNPINGSIILKVPKGMDLRNIVIQGDGFFSIDPRYIDSFIGVDSNGSVSDVRRNSNSIVSDIIDNVNHGNMKGIMSENVSQEAMDYLKYYKNEISNAEAYLDQCIKYSLEKHGNYTPENFLKLKNKLMSGEYGSNYISSEVRQSFEQYYNYRKECIDYVNNLKNSRVNNMFGEAKANEIRERLEAVGYTVEQINDIFSTKNKKQIEQMYKNAQNMFTTDEINQIGDRLAAVGYTVEQINDIFNTKNKKQIEQMYKDAQNMFTTDEVNQIGDRLAAVGYTIEQINDIFNTKSKQQIEEIYRNAQNMFTVDETNTIVDVLKQVGYTNEQINDIFKMSTAQIMEFYNSSLDYINNNSNPLQRFMSQNNVGNNNSLYYNNRYYGVEQIVIDQIRNALLKYNNQCEIKFWGGKDERNFMNFVIGNEPAMPLLNSYKIYLPVEGAKSVNNLDIILNYMIKNNIASNNKIFRTTGTDGICLRIYDANDAAKVIDFINNNPSIDVTATPSPFARQYGKVAISMDGKTSYNSRAISAYSNYISQTQQPTIAGFMDYLKDIKQQIDNGHTEAFDVFNNNSYNARESLDNMVNTYQIIETLISGLDSNVSIQEYFSLLQKHQTVDNYNELFYKMIDFIRVQ